MNPDQLAELGPWALALVVYLEVRIRPVLRELARLVADDKTEHEKTRAELAKTRAVLPVARIVR